MPRAANNTAIDKAILLQESGHFEQADRIYLRILRGKPGHAQALHMRGVLKIQQGEYELSEHLLKKAAKVAQDDPWIHFHLAQALAANAHHDAALKHYANAIDGGINNADVHFMRGNSFFELKRMSEAVNSLSKSLELDPADTSCRLNLANALEAHGDIEQAISHIEGIATHERSPLPIRLQHVGMLARSKRFLETHSRIRFLDIENSNHAAQILDIAKLLNAHARQQSLVELLSPLLAHTNELEPKHFDALMGLMCDNAKHETAEPLIASYYEKRERTAWSWFQSGICAQTRGQFDVAGECHLHALRQNRLLGAAAYSLSKNGNVTIDDNTLADWKNTLADKSVNDAQRGQFGFAVAHTLDQRGQYSDAFDEYRHANAQFYDNAPFDADKWDSYIDSIIETFNNEFFERTKKSLTLDSLPETERGSSLFFVVGMPRSGSTMLEQLLIRQAGVIGLGEHNVFRNITTDTAEITGFKRKAPLDAAKLTSEQLSAFRSRYLESIHITSDTASTVPPPHVDKMLSNFLGLGLLALVFPDARVLHCSRNPLATAVSCYTNLFNSGLRFSYDLYALGRAINAYQRLMTHWHKVLPLAIKDVQYESLVSDPVSYQEDIFSFLDLHPSKHQQDDSDTSVATNPINTASFWQARQPISDSSRDAWSRFDAYLGPLHEGLTYKVQGS